MQMDIYLLQLVVYANFQTEYQMNNRFALVLNQIRKKSYWWKLQSIL